MIKPVDVRAYFEYKCSKCGAPHIEVELKEIQSIPRPIKCQECPNVDIIRPIRDLVVRFNRTVPTSIPNRIGGVLGDQMQGGDSNNKTNQSYKFEELFQKIKNRFQCLGYTSREISNALKTVNELHDTYKMTEEEFCHNIMNQLLSEVK